jgi:hypothetical protein
MAQLIGKSEQWNHSQGAAREFSSEYGSSRQAALMPLVRKVFLRNRMAPRRNVVPWE